MKSSYWKIKIKSLHLHRVCVHSPIYGLVIHVMWWSWHRLTCCIESADLCVGHSFIEVELHKFNYLLKIFKFPWNKKPSVIWHLLTKWQNICKLGFKNRNIKQYVSSILLKSVKIDMRKPIKKVSRENQSVFKFTRWFK